MRLASLVNSGVSHDLAIVLLQSCPDPLPLSATIFFGVLAAISASVAISRHKGGDEGDSREKQQRIGELLEG